MKSDSVLGSSGDEQAGMVQGVFHVELKYTSRGPRLIEVNCRMGGGPVRNTNLLVWGVDLVEEHLLTCAGIPSRPPIAAKPLMYIAEYSINAQKTGKMQHIDFLKVKPCMGCKLQPHKHSCVLAWLAYGAWAAWYSTALLITLMPKGIVFSFLFLFLLTVISPACIACSTVVPDCVIVKVQ